MFIDIIPITPLLKAKLSAEEVSKEIGTFLKVLRRIEKNGINKKHRLALAVENANAIINLADAVKYLAQEVESLKENKSSQRE